MDAKQLLSELETLAEKLEVDVRYDRFTGEGARGGICKVKGRWRVILERRSADTEKISVLARCLSRFELRDQVVSPEAAALLQRQGGSESSEG